MNSQTSITAVTAWEALDSRGRPTVAARVDLRGGAVGVAAVPSGASTGTHEARELRDGGDRYAGFGVRTAVGNVRDRIAPSIVGIDADERGAVDRALYELDPSPQHADIGANAVLAVSIAVTRAAAAAAGVSLARYEAGSGPLLIPMPMVNIVSGGAHAGGLIDIQDILVIPTAASSFGQAIEWSARVRDAATALGRSRGHEAAVLVADEGGLGLPLRANHEALALVVDAIGAAGLVAGEQVHLAVDVAANQFFDAGEYVLSGEGRRLTSLEMIDEIRRWCREYPVVSVEDALAEDDWDAWAQLTAVLGGDVDLVGDDLFVTNPQRLERGIRSSVANSVLVKVNQNGTLTGAREVLNAAQDAGYRTVVSARSGETEEAWLADLAVGWRGGQIKVGSTHRSERVAKWNRLLEFEATEETEFAGPWPDGRPPRGSA